MTGDLRSAVLTARAGTATLAATRATGDRVRLDSAFRITLDRPGDAGRRPGGHPHRARDFEGTVTQGDFTSDVFVFTPAAGLTVRQVLHRLPGRAGRHGRRSVR